MSSSVIRWALSALAYIRLNEYSAGHAGSESPLRSTGRRNPAAYSRAFAHARRIVRMRLVRRAGLAAAQGVAPPRGAARIGATSIEKTRYLGALSAQPGHAAVGGANIERHDRWGGALGTLSRGQAASRCLLRPRRQMRCASSCSKFEITDIHHTLGTLKCLKPRLF